MAVVSQHGVTILNWHVPFDRYEAHSLASGAEAERVHEQMHRPKIAVSPCVLYVALMSHVACDKCIALTAHGVDPGGMAERRTSAGDGWVVR